MVGRATFGRPWIFKEIRDSIDNAPFEVSDVVPSTHKAMTADWMLDVLKEQVRQSVERIDEYRGILHVRRHLAATPLFKGLPNFRQTRIEMLRAETVESLFDIMERIRPLLHGESAPTLF
jgi:tRNA-dihydrouridine synthase B